MKTPKNVWGGLSFFNEIKKEPKDGFKLHTESEKDIKQLIEDHISLVKNFMANFWKK